MIFVTVGTQLPFDRLIMAVDEWAARSGADVLAQTGPASAIPHHIRTVPSLAADEFDAAMAGASLIIAHAGMGTILSGLMRGKPVIIMPRRAQYGEHRNDHQLATADRLKHLRGLYVAQDGAALADLLRHPEKLTAGPAIGATASPRLIHAIREFIAA